MKLSKWWKRKTRRCCYFCNKIHFLEEYCILKQKETSYYSICKEFKKSNFVPMRSIDWKEEKTQPR